MLERSKRTSRMAALHGAAMYLLCATCLGALQGCVSAEPERAKPPEKQPEWAVPSRLLAAIQLPEDTDANGYLDTIPMSVYLFDEHYPLAVAVPGTFTFELHGSTGKTIGTWEFDEAESAKLVRKLRPGPGYQFRLDVRKFGSDVRDTATVDITVEFKPVKGNRVRGASATTFRLGKAGGY